MPTGLYVESAFPLLAMFVRIIYIGFQSLYRTIQAAFRTILFTPLKIIPFLHFLCFTFLNNSLQKICKSEIVFIPLYFDILQENLCLKSIDSVGVIIRCIFQADTY